MYYVFENRITNELIAHKSLKKVYRVAISTIKTEYKEFNWTPDACIFKVEDDDLFNNRHFICGFPNYKLLADDVKNTGLLSVRGFHAAKRNGLNTGEDLLEALSRNLPLRSAGKKTKAEWRSYIVECFTTPER